MEKILVTGATGFLGKYLVDQLISDGYKVYALGRNEAAGTALREMGAVFCKGDFTDKDGCRQYFKDIDYVIHAGALSTVWGKWEDFYNVNVEGTQNVCELCIENNVKRMIYVSSPSIYSGKQHRFDIKEAEYDSSNELNYYIKSKIMSENVIKEFNQKGLYTVVVRPRGLFGIGDTSLIPRILKANANIGIPLFNKGSNYVDITCVENVAYALSLCVSAEAVNGEAFNISNGEPMQFKEILVMFLESINAKAKYLKLPFGLVYNLAGFLEWSYRAFKRKGEPALTKYTVCTLAFSQTLDISKAVNKLKYKPIKTISEGITQYGEWWKADNRN